MKAFLDENFLLSTQTAEILYHQYAAALPIIDYHCHVNPREIAEDFCAENLTQLWLNGDHYKWRLMRACGIPEEEITGNADDKTKFLRFAAVLEKAIGSPVYHWAHLELKRYFGYDGILNTQTAEEVWQLTTEMLTSLSVREIIRRSKVEVIISTDDPIDSLENHQKLAKDFTFNVKVLPGWRPDKSLNLQDRHYLLYLSQLSEASHQPIHSISDLKKALSVRMDYFAECGSIISDHGLNKIPFAPAANEEIENIFQKRLAGEVLSQAEIDTFQYALLQFLAGEYHSRGWVMQIHYGAVRNTNQKMFARLGPDTGYDCIGQGGNANEIASFLNELDEKEQLPKTILYSLNPNDNAMLATIAGCFSEYGINGRVQHGAAWWFNDTKQGMEQQLTNYANQSVLGNFIGMLTDSRSFLSYTRHEYFRRILCDLLGRWYENGEIGSDIDALGQIVQDISYYNAKRFFNL